MRVAEASSSSTRRTAPRGPASTRCASSSESWARLAQAAAKVENLLVAGRSISVDHELNAGTRGAATCMAVGHAAGTAAALAVKVGVAPRQLDVEQLRAALREQKQILAKGEQS